MQLKPTWYHCHHLQCGHRGKWSQRNMSWELGKEPQLYSTRQPPSNPCPVSYLYFAVFVRWRMPERVRQLSCSMKCFKATYFSKLALKSKIWNEVKSNLNIIDSANAWTGTVHKFCTQAWDGFSTRISTYTITVPTKDVLNITFMIPPLLLIVISCASVKDLCRSMCHKSIYLCLLGVFTAEDCAFRYAKKLSIQSRWDDARLNITSALLSLGWQHIG